MVDINDVPYEVAYLAYRHSSFDPERRARGAQQEYVDLMGKMVKAYGHLPGADGEIEQFRTGFLKRYLALLSAKSRVASPMITGPAKFPHARNRKALDTEDRRRQELIEWQEKAIDRIEKNLGLKEKTFISSDESDAVEQLQAKLNKMEQAQLQMKDFNKAARAKGEPAPYQGWQLSNNSANIRRVKERIADLERRAGDTTTELTFGSITIIDNVEDNRVQILFPGKPDESTRRRLKSCGFRWAPSVGAWQRHRTSAALRVAKEIVEEDGE